MAPLLTFEIQKAICRSTLPADLRHLLMVMALLADGRTGIGTASQATIAGCMGCTDRHVRSLLARLSATEGSPVTLDRRRRGVSRGRLSDEYRLVLSAPEQEQCSASAEGAQQEQHSGSDHDPNRNSVPVREKAEPEQHDSRTGSPRHPKRNVRSDDQLSDQLSINSSAAKRRGKPLKDPSPGVHELKLHYVAEFERTRNAKPNFGKAWSRAMKAFGDMLLAHKLDGAKQIITTALGDQWVRRINPWELRDDANKYIGKQPVRGRQIAVQRGADEAVANTWGKDGAARLLDGS